MQSAPLSPGRWKRHGEDNYPGRVAIFTDDRAAIRRVALEEPGPGHMYAL